MRTLYLILYYGFARFLPKSAMPIIGKISWWIRHGLCRRIFAKCGKSLNVEQGAYFGNGKDVQVGNYISIGKNFKMLSRSLVAEDYL